MLSDFGVIFFWPVIVGSAVLLIFALVAKPSQPGQGVLRIGGKRLTFGYLGILAATALYVVADTYFLGVEKVALGHIPADELPTRIAGWSLGLFGFVSPIVLFLVTLFGLPLFALFSKHGWGTLLGVVLIAAICSVAYTAYVFVFPHNDWCQSNLGPCLAKSLVGFGMPALTVAVGFGLAARLPIVRRPARADEPGVD